MTGDKGFEKAIKYSGEEKEPQHIGTRELSQASHSTQQQSELHSERTTGSKAMTE